MILWYNSKRRALIANVVKADYKLCAYRGCRFDSCLTLYFNAFIDFAMIGLREFFGILKYLRFFKNIFGIITPVSG